ncbi:hypothetical protein IC744_16255 [Microbacterium hominis]|nr:hypothetical protein IC744_16255 [Microbacterium hominis]
MDTVTVTEAPVCPDNHKHGLTATCYTSHGCRCLGCRAAQAATKRTERRLQAYGRWDRAPRLAGHARAHVLVLSRFGYAYEHIARAANINPRTVYQIATGRVTRIHYRVHSSILAIEPKISDLDPATRIPSTGSRRRVQALACRGWSIEALAAQLGITRSALTQRVNAGGTTVRAHLQLAELYEQIWNTRPVPTSDADAAYITRTIRRAQRAGWMPPMAWDDIDTDPEPQTGEDAPVDEIAVELAVHGNRIRLTRDERLLAVRQLHAAGHSDELIAHMLLVSDKTITRDREHLGLVANEDPTPLIRKLAA